MYACDYLFYCLSIYFKRILHIDIIRTLSANIQFICMSFKTADRRAIFFSCFAAIANELNIFRHCTYILFIPQCQKIQITSKLCKKSKISVVLIIFLICSQRRPRVYCYRFVSWLYMDKVSERLYLGQWKYITKQYPGNVI